MRPFNDPRRWSIAATHGKIDWESAVLTEFSPLPNAPATEPAGPFAKTGRQSWREKTGIGGKAALCFCRFSSSASRPTRKG